MCLWCCFYRIMFFFAYEISGALKLTHPSGRAPAAGPPIKDGDVELVLPLRSGRPDWTRGPATFTEPGSQTQSSLSISPAIFSFAFNLLRSPLIRLRDRSDAPLGGSVQTGQAGPRLSSSLWFCVNHSSSQPGALAPPDHKLLNRKD